MRALKRAIDMIAAGCGLVFLLPPMALISLAILLKMGQPLLFRQTRSGRDGARFTLLKFRTMTEEYDGAGRLLPDSGRLTGLGRFLRERSLDELPQLWNVLMGEMSLVGPRPLLPQYDDRYDAVQRRRLAVLPGITGWAQIHGRNTLAWEPRFEHDVWYVDHWSIWLDARIVAKTILCVLSRSGITAHEHATMPEFLGSTQVSSFFCRATQGVEKDADST